MNMSSTKKHPSELGHTQDAGGTHFRAGARPAALAASRGEELVALIEVTVAWVVVVALVVDVVVV